jgi:DNA invertase Pin-like site-specific DNA recombinase
MSRRAVAYLRTNVDVFNGGDQMLRRQKEIVDELAAERGVEVVGYVEASTPYSGDRWADLWLLLRERRAETVIASHVDRIARDPRRLADLLTDGVDVLTPDIDSATQYGREFIAALLV